ncbi:MAG: shikimate kinase [Cyanobacteriota bacterium]
MNDLLQGTSVFLVGMMGSGKSTVGRLLAHQLGYRFYDSDVVIERVADKTINQIFADDGKESFRQLESQVLSQLSAQIRSIIATGGGIVMQQLNWSYLHHGLVIWLDAPVDVLIDRLREDTTRPLLQQENPIQTLQNIFDQRRNLYAEADLHIRISAEDTPEQIVSRIIAEIPTVLKSPAIAPSPPNEGISN